MAQIRFEDLKEGLTLKDMQWECFFLEYLLNKEDAEEIHRRFKEYHGENPDYDEMPAYRFILENVEVKLKYGDRIIILKDKEESLCQKVYW